MNRRSFVRAAAASALGVGAGRKGLALAGGEARSSGLPDATRVGWLGTRFGLTLDRVLSGSGPTYSEDFVLADVKPTPERRFTEYSGDVSGRYIGALATAIRVYGVQAPALDALVDKVIALQKPEGYFGAAFHEDK